MNLIDAIKSGRPFRRNSRKCFHTCWFHVKRSGCTSFIYWDDGKEDKSANLMADDILADDWEIQEPSVTVTLHQLLQAFGYEKNDSGRRGHWGCPSVAFDQLIDAARRLGLEGGE